MLDPNKISSYLIERPTDDGTNAEEGTKSSYRNMLNDDTQPLPGRNKRQSGHWDRDKKSGSYQWKVDREWYE